MLLLLKGLSIRMMKPTVLTAKNFLKLQKLLQSYECNICHQICVKPVKCTGTCAHIYCMKCVSNVRQELDSCPDCGNSPFLVSLLPEIATEFSCPYSLLCQSQIKSLSQFNNHFQDCRFVPSQEIQRKKMEREYKCLEGHQLQFYIGSYQQMVASTCHQCAQLKLCRSYCRACKEFYCVECRAPPCSQQGCPIGHSFKFQRLADLNYICDICSISTAVSNSGIFDDPHCNFGICEGCFSQLPEKQELCKAKALININTKCGCGEPLLFSNALHTLSPCQLCCKSKECPKYCASCGKRYCLECKLMDIYSNSTCGLEHRIVKISIFEQEQLMLKQGQFGCMRCGGKQSEYYYDAECFTRLCEKCFTYCIKVTIDKQRPVLLRCERNHSLMYIWGEDHWDTCAKCHQLKIVKLACNFCQEGQRNYCFQCRPIPLTSCYYRHSLFLTRLSAPHHCHYCARTHHRFYHCSKCLFFVCITCQRSNISPKQQQQNEEQSDSIPEET